MKLRFIKGQKVRAKCWRGTFIVDSYCAVGEEYMYQITDGINTPVWVNSHVITSVDEPVPTGAQLEMF